MSATLLAGLLLLLAPEGEALDELSALFGYRVPVRHAPLREGDIRNAGLVAECVAGVDAIFHLAASIGNGSAWEIAARYAMEIAKHKLAAALGYVDTNDREEIGRFVQVALDRLPAHYGNALEWKYLENLPVKEIASRLEMGPKAAESLLTRAREAFRQAHARLTTAPRPAAEIPRLQPQRLEDAL